MTWDFPRINAIVLKSIQTWQLRNISNLWMRAHQCASTVLSTKDSVSHRASGHPWQNLDYDSLTTGAGEVNAGDDYNITAKLSSPPFPKRERESAYVRRLSRFSKKACWHGFLEHARVSRADSISEAHSSAD